MGGPWGERSTEIQPIVTQELNKPWMNEKGNNKSKTNNALLYYKTSMFNMPNWWSYDYTLKLNLPSYECANNLLV